MNDDEEIVKNIESELLFYTPKIAQQIDDKEIVEEIFYRYPNLKIANVSKEEKEERKVFLEFFKEKKLILDILTKYNISIVDLIKILHRKFSYLFSTSSYINKVKLIIDSNGYSKINKT